MFWIWILGFVLSILILLWIRLGVLDYYTNERPKFVKRGLFILFCVLAAIPIIGIIEFGFLIILYIVFRLEDDWVLKDSKISKFLEG